MHSPVHPPALASFRRKQAVPSRRRRDDEDDEEGSVAADIDDDSLSEGSAISPGDDDADVEGSEASDREPEGDPEPVMRVSQTNGHTGSSKHSTNSQIESTTKGVFKASVDTEAMMNGLKIAEDTKADEEISFDEMVLDTNSTALRPVQEQQPVTRHETPAERSRREHQEYLKQRDANPAFVPNRGGFFLHDNRSTTTGMNGVRPFPRGRGRGTFNGMQSSRGPLNNEPTEQQWAHDLHDSTLKTNASATPAMPLPIASGIKSSAHANLPKLPGAQATPNRSFSSSTLLGNVPAMVNLPGMTKKIAVTVPKKQHTLLPQHRPPLRRDKPVRISLPDQHPRYIFPSVARSFIFIPRAQRPNQQSFARGRGRGSFNVSRRTSMYGGSMYSPSIAMSRRSSIVGGTSQNGIRSPVAGPPVVRLPPMTREHISMPMLAHSSTAGATAFNVAQPSPFAVSLHASMQHNQQPAIPMHQPRPQKAVSIADIESPASFAFKPPQQQQEQPFHQQVPTEVNGQAFIDQQVLFAHSRHPSHPSQPSGTPLSHIPERAIYAPTFQPFSFAPPQGYFPAPYPPNTLFYPPMGAEMPGYSSATATTVMAPAFVPGTPYVLAPPLPPPPPATDSNIQTGTVAHESNGMVYYYDSAQLQQSVTSGMTPPAGGVVGIGGMITPPSQYYYPPAPNGVYFTPQ